MTEETKTTKAKSTLIYFMSAEREWLKAEAKKKGFSMSAIIRMLIQEKMDNK